MHQLDVRVRAVLGRQRVQQRDVRRDVPERGVRRKRRVSVWCARYCRLHCVRRHVNVRAVYVASLPERPVRLPGAWQQHWRGVHQHRIG